MRPDSVASLTDVLTAASHIRGFIASGTDDEELIAAAVERQFVIIGEALSRLRNKDPEVFEKVTDGRKIIAFRNLLVHAYESVDYQLLVANTEAPLDRLIAEVEVLMAEAE